MEETAGGETKREDPKRKISKVVSRRPQTDSDDDDIDLDYRWETITPTVLPRAELIELHKEERVEPEEEAFHGFDEREVEEALELQALFIENDSGGAREEGRPNIELSLEIVENEEMETDQSVKKRKNYSHKERKKRKAAARAH